MHQGPVTHSALSFISCQGNGSRNMSLSHSVNHVKPYRIKKKEEEETMSS